jgi:hypothetical protein
MHAFAARREGIKARNTLDIVILSFATEESNKA